MNLTILTTLLALVASSAVASADSTHNSSVNVPAVQYTDAGPEANSRQLRGFSFGFGRRSGGGGASGSTPSTGGGTSMGAVNPVANPGAGLGKRDAFDATVSGIGLAAAVIPLVPKPGSSGPCRQVPCWIAAPTEACARAAADKVQSDIMRGRDAFHVESTNAAGIWVRFWRTKFMPPNTDKVADGSCGGGGNFVVSNCQPGSEVKC